MSSLFAAKCYKPIADGDNHARLTSPAPGTPRGQRGQHAETSEIVMPWQTVNLPAAGRTGSVTIRRLDGGVRRAPAWRMCLQRKQFLAPGSHQPSGEPGLTGVAVWGAGITGCASAGGGDAGTAFTCR
jgi:hypothetical protein